MEDDIIMKPFVIDGGEYWITPQHKSNSVLRLFKGKMEIEVEMFTGCNPVANDLFNFVLNDKDVRFFIKKYYQIGRVKPYRINISNGMSGRQDVYINYYDRYGLEIDGKHLLHISCAGKISGIKRMYIGDFAEMMYALDIKGDNTSGRYTKPYFSNDICNSVHKLYKI